MVMVKQDKSNKKAIFGGWRVMARPVLVAATAVDWLCPVKYNSNQAAQAPESVTMTPTFRRRAGFGS